MQLAEAVLGGAFEIVRREMRGPDLGGHEHVVALDSGGAQAVADIAFVLVDLRGVDVAIAEPQRLLDQTGAGAPAQFLGTEPDRGNDSAVGLDDELHGRILERSSPVCPAATVAGLSW